MEQHHMRNTYQLKVKKSNKSWSITCGRVMCWYQTRFNWPCLLTKTDIQNHIYLAQRARLIRKIGILKFKKDSPNSSFYFRPYTESTKVSDTGQNLFDDTLYVHQEPWQQQKVKCGNTLYLMDATYKTTKYELALLLWLLKPMWGTPP